MEGEQKALLFSLGEAGHALPMLDVAHAISSFGFEVTFFSPRRWKEAAAAAGAKWAPYMDDEDWDVIEFAKIVMKDVLKVDPLYSSVKMPLAMALLPATVGLLPFLKRVVGSLRPVLIVYDAAAPWGQAIGQMEHITHISVLPSFPCAPVIKFSRTSNAALAVLRDEGVKIESQWFAFGPTTFVCMERDWVREEAHACDAGCHFSRSQHREGFLFVGPSLLLASSGWWKDEIDRSLSEWLSLQKAACVVYVSLGTIVTQAGWSPSVPEFYRFIWNCFSNQAEYAVIVSYGQAEVPVERPCNIFATPFLNQRALLKSGAVSVFVSHGGSTGIQEALAFNVKLLVMPCYEDQLANAKWLSERGWAASIPFPMVGRDWYDESGKFTLSQEIFLGFLRTALEQTKIGLTFSGRSEFERFMESLTKKRVQ